jgi:hypothetical protein
VLTDITVIWDGGSTFVRKGTVVDIAPGSALETAYGGLGNLSAVIPVSQRGPGNLRAYVQGADHVGHSGLANWDMKRPRALRTAGGGAARAATVPASMRSR